MMIKESKYRKPQGRRRGGERWGKGGTEKNTNEKTQKTNSRIELENSEELFLNLGHSGIL